MCFGEITVKLKGLRGELSGLPSSKLKRQNEIVSQQAVRVCQARVARCIFWILCNSRLKQFFRLLELVPISPLEETASLQIADVGRNVFSCSRIQPILLLLKKLQFQRLGYLLCYLSLDRKDIVQLAIVILRPDVFFVFGVDQLDRHAYALSRHANTTFHHRSDLKLLRNLRDPLLFTRVVLRRRPGDDSKALQLREHCNQFLSHSICEVRVFRVGADVGEWENGEPALVKAEFASSFILPG